MSYYLAPSLVDLCAEVDDRYAPPPWPTVSAGDGWIGDPSHAARPSDHNPDWNAGGVVRAVDIGTAGRNGRAILNQTIGDPRVWYVIHDSRIYSRTHGWAANRYTGNPHAHHIHVSIRHGRQYEEDRRPWFGPSRPGRTKGGMPIVVLSHVRVAFEDARPNTGVKRIQRALNDRYGLNLETDGRAGPNTREAWQLHERAMGVRKPNPIPHAHSLRHLGRGRFAVRER